MLALIIFVLGLFKFLVTLNIFTRFPWCTSFIFATVSYRSSSSSCCSLASSSLTAAAFSSSSSPFFYTMSFNLSFCLYPIFSIILLYNKEVISLTLYRFSASASCVAVTGADTACIILKLYFSKMNSSFLKHLKYFWEILWTFYGQKKMTPCSGHFINVENLWKREKIYDYSIIEDIHWIIPFIDV